MAQNFEDCYNHFEKMRRFTYPMVVKIVKNHHDAEDVLQEVLIILSQIFPELDLETLDGWILTTTRNRAINRYRENIHQQRFILLSSLENSSIEEIPACEDLLTVLEDEEETQEKLNRYLSQLRPDVRALFMYRLEGLKFVEIAEITGKPMNTIKSKLWRSMGKLKHSYEAGTSLE